MRKVFFLIVLIFVLIGFAFCQEGQFLQRKEFPQLKPPQGPFYDEIWGATSFDGINFKILPGPFFHHASVPDILELTNDSLAGRRTTLFLYFVDFSEIKGPGQEVISLSRSKDGFNWSEKEKVIIQGKINKGACVDPSVIELPDRRIRMFFFGSEVTDGDPASGSGEHKIYSAISKDGINFEVELGIRYQAPFITDPEVLFTGKEWLMFLSKGQEIILCRSLDGLNFTPDPDFTLEIGGVAGAVQLPDKKIRIFATGKSGITSAIFMPDISPQPLIENGQRIPLGNALLVADPACVRRLDGSYYLIFKKQPQRQRI